MLHKLGFLLGIFFTSSLAFGQAFQGPAIIKSPTTINHCVIINATGSNVIRDGGACAAGTVTSVSGTANQIDSTGGATPVLSLSSTLQAPGTLTVSGITTVSDLRTNSSTTGSNAFLVGGTGVSATSSDPLIDFTLNGGTTPIQYRGFISGSTATTLTANASFANYILGAGTVTEAASGTHGFVTGLAVMPPTITAGAGLSDIAATLFIPSSPSGSFGTGAFSIYVLSGTSFFHETKATTLALNNCTISSSALCATGTANISGATSLGNVNVTAATVPVNGVYLSAANTVAIAANSAIKVSITTAALRDATSTSGAAMLFGAASATNPTIVPNRSDLTTGFGAQASGNISAIVAAAEVARFTSTGINNSAIGATIASTGAFTTLTATSFNGNTLTASTGILTLGAGKTLTASNTLTLTGTDGSNVAFGTGGTVLYSGGSYAASITGTANEITASTPTGAVTLSLPSSLTFTGKTVTGGSYAAIAGLGLRNAGTGAFDLTIAANGTMTAGRMLTLNLNDAARTVSIAGDITTVGPITLSGSGAAATNGVAFALGNSSTITMGSTPRVYTFPNASLSVAGINFAQTWSANQTFGSGNLIATNPLFTVPADTAQTDNSLCVNTTSHNIYSGTGTLGICLGTSSARYKTNIEDLTSGLDQIMALRPRTFNYLADYGDPNKLQYGFIAEESQQALPNLVGLDADNNPNTFDYLGVVPVLVKAIQQQQEEITELKNEVAALKN